MIKFGFAFHATEKIILPIEGRFATFVCFGMNGHSANRVFDLVLVMSMIIHFAFSQKLVFAKTFWLVKQWLDPQRLLATWANRNHVNWSREFVANKLNVIACGLRKIAASICIGTSSAKGEDLPKANRRQAGNASTRNHIVALEGFRGAREERR